MKKVIGWFFVVLLSISLMGCSGKDEKKEEANYVVVEMSEGTTVNDLFEFESVSKTVLDGELSKIDVADGCYCNGAPQGGNSVIWRSDDDGYGYDDRLFIYVEDKVSDVQLVGYASKLKETPMSYEDFKERYK